jgi:undecaprenyl-diphosphatase
MFEKIQQIDNAVLNWFQEHQTGFLNQFFVGITHSTFLILVVALAFLGLLIASGRLGKAVSALLFIGVAIGCTEVGKYCFERPRPVITNHVIPTPDSPSMPSGHATTSMAVLLIAALSFCRRRYWIFWALLLSFLIGLSRLYLGVHFLSDVLVGWLVGLFFALEYYWLVIRGDNKCSSIH